MISPSLPSTIILDLRAPYQRFEKEAQPYLLGTKTTPESIAEELWEAMFDQDTVDERLLDAVVDIGRKEQYANAAVGGSFGDVVHDLALQIYERIGQHKLYDGRGYLPFNMQVQHRGLFVLKLDRHLDKVQQEMESADEDENDDIYKNEYVGLRQ